MNKKGLRARMPACLCVCVCVKPGYNYTEKLKFKEHLAISVIFLVHYSKHISLQMLLALPLNS